MIDPYLVFPALLAFGMLWSCWMWITRTVFGRPPKYERPDADSLEGSYR